MFCLGGFWQGGFLSGGLCPGGFCLGGFCPDTRRPRDVCPDKIDESSLITSPPHPRPKVNEVCFFSSTVTCRGTLHKRTELLIITELSHVAAEVFY